VDNSARCGGHPVSSGCINDSLPSEVSPLVVRLEPGTNEIQLPGRSLFTALRDEYPSTDEEQAVHIDFPYPDAKSLNRWLPLIKWFLAIPHIIVLAILANSCFSRLDNCLVCYPVYRALPALDVRLYCWVFTLVFAVEAYAFLLITDRYPPFSLSPLRKL